MDYLLNLILSWADKNPDAAITIVLASSILSALVSVDMALGDGLSNLVGGMITNLCC